ncbi:MFS transporter, partial [Chloroflexota bacterium]
MSDEISPRDAGQDPIQTGHYLWVMLSLVTVLSLALGLMRMGIPVLYPFIQSEFKLSRAQVGLITSFLATGNAITAIFAGWLTDFFGVKRVITITLLIITAFLLAFPLTYSF